MKLYDDMIDGGFDAVPDFESGFESDHRTEGLVYAQVFSPRSEWCLDNNTTPRSNQSC